MATIREKLGRPNGPYYHGLLSQPACASCPLRNTIKVYPDGPVPAAIAFVGEEPGRRELGEGRGFVGPSGQLLWMLAAQIGYILQAQTGYNWHITREQLWVTNATLCKSTSVVLSNRARLPRVEVQKLAAQCCRARLVHELRIVDPIVTVPLGNWAGWALADMERFKIYAYRGSRILIDLDTLAQRIATGTEHAKTRTLTK